MEENPQSVKEGRFIAVLICQSNPVRSCSLAGAADRRSKHEDQILSVMISEILHSCLSSRHSPRPPILSCVYIRVQSSAATDSSALLRLDNSTGG